MTGHEFWDQQAAGYALDALEPEENAEFEQHLADCIECQQQVDQHVLVAAQLGALAYDDRPAPTWGSIRAGIVAPTDESPTNVVPLRRRRSVAVMSAAAAAVAALVGITVWQTTGDSGPEPLASASACARTAGCHVVELAVRGTGGTTAASVLVYGHDVGLVSSTMPKPPAGSEWALWRLPKSGSAQLMTTFAETNGTRTALGLPYRDIAGFAVSREPAGSTPTAPSTVVAYGPVT